MDREFERRICAEAGFAGGAIICGCDEVGRGPLAGPVVAAAVVLPEGELPDGLNDSKKLTEKRRAALAEQIKSCSVAWAIGQASPEEIDRINILQASMLAMRRAVEALGVTPALALIDGNRADGFTVPTVTVVGGDAKCPSIAAASIIAKVARDELMIALDSVYPGYGFAAHKGYPTKAHYAALAALKPSPIHRKTFRLQ